MWDKKIVDIGNVETGENYTVIFNYKGDLKVKNVSSSCGCTRPKVMGNKITVVYKPKTSNKYPYVSVRYVTVLHKNGKFDKLLIKSNVHEEI